MLKFLPSITLAFLAFVMPIQVSHADEGRLNRPVLTVLGDFPNGSKGVEFSIAELEDLGLLTIRTETPWHEGTVEFIGTRVIDILNAVGAQGKWVEATALNDYKILIPFTDFEEHDVILAFKMDGEYMQIRDKGPLFIIYPYASHPELRTQEYYGRSVWQLGQLRITNDQDGS